MIDIKWVQENEDEFNRSMQKRGAKINVTELLNLEAEKRSLTTLMQEFQQAKNEKTKRLASLKNKSANEFQDLKKDVTHINEKLTEISSNLSGNDEFQKMMDNIPNILDKEVPVGENEDMNHLVSTHLEPKKISWAKEHFDLGKNLGMMDFEQTAKISGSRFVSLKGDLARLERALINFMIDIHAEKLEAEEISAPVLVRPTAMYNVGQLPKFSEDSYLTSDEKYRLIPTGEVPLVNMVADTMLKKEELPLRYVTYSECFRSEAGSAGRDTRGMIRNHQFGKVELVSITRPEDSEAEHKKMLSSSEEVLKRLELPYRVMLLCSGDMGFAAQKTYDIEVWLPGQDKYREIASISNCGDFQARRMKARYKNEDKKTTLVHTLNGSGVAVGRMIVAIMENYQNADGSITVPQALRSYMGGKEFIK